MVQFSSSAVCISLKFFLQTLFLSLLQPLLEDLKESP